MNKKCVPSAAGWADNTLCVSDFHFWLCTPRRRICPWRMLLAFGGKSSEHTGKSREVTSGYCFYERRPRRLQHTNKSNRLDSRFPLCPPQAPPGGYSSQDHTWNVSPRRSAVFSPCSPGILQWSDGGLLLLFKCQGRDSAFIKNKC